MEKQKRVSLKRRIIVVLLALLIPLVLALNTYALYINYSYSIQVAELNEASLSGYVDQVSDTLLTAQEALNSIIGGSYDFLGLKYQLDPVEAFSRAYNVNTNLKKLVTSQQNITSMVIYSKKNAQFMPSWGSAGLAAQTAMREFINNWNEESWSKLPGRWKLVELAGNHYLVLVQYIKSHTENTYDVHLFCFVSLDKLAERSEKTVAYTGNGEYLTSRQLAAENRLPAPAANSRVIAAGSPRRFMLLSHSIPHTQVEAVYLLPTVNFLSGVGAFQLLLLLISIIAIALIPLGFWWIKKELFKPLDDIVTAMEAAGSGDLTVRAPLDYRDLEFKTMSVTFNDMLAQIQSLKIESYEKELAAKQARLSFLQMQIRPHFYLNCMKNLYSLAQDRKIDNIQEMLVLLSNYLRYMMDSDIDRVTLEQEVQNSCNYLSLQQFNQAYPPDCKISVDANVLDVHIPPVTVLTFIENCVKHAAPENELIINLRARRLTSEDGDVLLLSIKDNGVGFSSDVLDKLNRINETQLEGGHVGITNVWQRLQLLYGEDCGIAFSNSDGAHVELFIPIR